MYDLDRSRMESSIELSITYNRSRKRSLSAPDAVFISLAEELAVNVVSFEKYFAEVSRQAVVPA